MPRPTRPPNRREFLGASAGLLCLPLVPEFGPRHRPRPSRFRADPFQLGTASGEPHHDSVVLWTRLCAEPLAPDGGMGTAPVDVSWEVASDESMRTIVRNGTVQATAELGHAVHVECDGLQPDRWYWYRFRAGAATSPIGRTRTFPAPDQRPERLRFAFASCQHWEQGLFTAYADMAEQDLDLVVHLGDFIYEYAGKDGLVRKHHGGKLHTLSDYRVRHAQYRSDPLLHRMMARCPWLVTWDDHEVENNYASAIREKKGKSIAEAEFLDQRAAAYRAYYEAMPLRRSSMPKGPDMQLYRRSSFGTLAELFVLDTRQHRSDQPNGDGKKPRNDAARAAGNTLLGAEQKQWLFDGLAGSKARWNVLAQQVMMGLVGFPPKPAKAEAGNRAVDANTRRAEERLFSMDQWPGYSAEREQLLRFLAERKVENPIVLTGDIHASFVNELRIDDHDASAPIVATEFVGTSISSGGDGSDAATELQELQRHNPGLQFLDRRRGYVACTVTPSEWRSEYRTVDAVTRPGGRTRTRATFRVAAGQPGIRG
jgi:alkaline phosphatase D